MNSICLIIIIEKYYCFRTKPSSVNKPENSGLTTFRINSAQAVGQVVKVLESVEQVDKVLEAVEGRQGFRVSRAGRQGFRGSRR